MHERINLATAVYFSSEEAAVAFSHVIRAVTRIGLFDLSTLT